MHNITDSDISLNYLLIPRIEEMSGRSKPPSVHCGIQLRALPGQVLSYPFALFWLAPAGIHRFIVSCPYALRVISCGTHFSHGGI